MLKHLIRRALLAAAKPLFAPARRAIVTRQQELLDSLAGELLACSGASLPIPSSQTGDRSDRDAYTERLACAIRHHTLLRENPAAAQLLQEPIPGAALPLMPASFWLHYQELQLRFPLPLRAASFLRWWEEAAPEHLRIDPLQLPGGPATVPPSIPFNERPFGVNVIGHAFNVFGIGEDSRCITAALQAAAIPCCVINHPADNGSLTTDRSLEHLVLPPGKEGPYAFNLVCMAAPIHARWYCREGFRQQLNHYTIASWPWELEHWPEAWEAPLAITDEAWPYSSIIENALRPFVSDSSKRHHIRLTRMPPPAEIPDAPLFSSSSARRDARHRFGLAEGRVLFVFGFDPNSTLTRKNPMAVVEAFRRAFPPANTLSEHVALVIKTFPCERPGLDWLTVRDIAAADCRMHIIEASLDRNDLLSLYGCCDCFVSLHRSEGLGRGHAEALQLGLDVIVTDYGSTTDFCIGPLAHPVRCRLVPVGDGEYFEGEGQVWADPDVDHAAELMRQVAQLRLQRPDHDPDLTLVYRQRFSYLNVGTHYRQRLEELWQERNALASVLKAGHINS